MYYRTRTETAQFGVSCGGKTAHYDNEATAHRGFLDEKDQMKNSFTGTSTSASVVLERAASQDWHDVETLVTYCISRSGTRNAAPVENTVYHAQIEAPSAPIPKPVVKYEPPKPRLYSIKTKVYYQKGEWDVFFETEEQARAALEKMMESEKLAIARENGDPRREYELLYNRETCIDSMEIYKNHEKVATVRK